MHKFSKDYTGKSLFLVCLKALIAFILFFLSNFFISKLPDMAIFQSTNSRTVQVLLIVLPTFAAVVLYALFSMLLTVNGADEQNGAGNPAFKLLPTTIAILMFLVFSQGIKAFLGRAFREDTVNALIFALLAALVFVILESLGKGHIESVSYVLFALPLCTIIMIFLTKGMVAFLRETGGRQLANTVGNALLWMLSLLVSVVLSKLFDSMTKMIWKEKQAK